MIALDDNIEDHPKFAGLSNDAFSLWIRCVGYCRRNVTDGFIPAPVAISRARSETPKEVIAELLRISPGCSNALWIAVEGGYLVHDYLDWNPSKDQVEEKLQALRDRGRRGGLKSGNSRAKAVPTDRSGSGGIDPLDVPTKQPAQPLLEAKTKQPASPQVELGASPQVDQPASPQVDQPASVLLELNRSPVRSGPIRSEEETKEEAAASLSRSESRARTHESGGGGSESEPETGPTDAATEPAQEQLLDPALALALVRDPIGTVKANPAPKPVSGNLALAAVRQALAKSATLYHLAGSELPGRLAAQCREHGFTGRHALADVLQSIEEASEKASDLTAGGEALANSRLISLVVGFVKKGPLKESSKRSDSNPEPEHKPLFDSAYRKAVGQRQIEEAMRELMPWKAKH